MTGRFPSGPGSRPTDEAEVFPSSSPKASIPSADELRKLAAEAIALVAFSRRQVLGFAALLDAIESAAPIPMILHCPECGAQHIDEVEHVLVWTGGSAPEPSHDEIVWDNPPHRSHLCHGCGCIWRPADVPTNGVAAIETVGKADTWRVPHRDSDGSGEASETGTGSTEGDSAGPEGIAQKEQRP